MCVISLFYISIISLNFEEILISLSFINDSLLAETPCFVLYYALTSVKKKKARWTGPLISSPAFCAAF